jgi:hypothetical protein
MDEWWRVHSLSRSGAASRPNPQPSSRQTRAGAEWGPGAPAHVKAAGVSCEKLRVFWVRAFPPLRRYEGRIARILPVMLSRTSHRDGA